MVEKSSAVFHERELRESWQMAHLARHEAEKEALRIARSDIDRRLEGMNELRHQITEERGLYLTRTLYDKEHTALREAIFSKLDALRDSTNNRFESLKSAMDTKADSVRDSADSRLKALESTKSNLEGRLWAIGAMISAVVIAINLGLHFLGAK